MTRRAFAATAADGSRVRMAPLPPQIRFMKVRFLGRTTIMLNAAQRDAALVRALCDAVAAIVPADRRSGMVTG